jgi:hypothetical protein
LFKLLNAVCVEELAEIEIQKVKASEMYSGE